MPRVLMVLLLVLVAVIYSTPAAHAIGVGSLAGETINGVPNMSGGTQSATHATCNGAVANIGYQVINQPATGPAPGFLNEFGTITVNNGVVTQWNVTGWHISQIAGGDGYINGSMTLQGNGTGSVSCTPGSPVVNSSGTVTADLYYNVTGDTGMAITTLTFDTVARSGSFQEKLVAIPNVIVNSPANGTNYDIGSSVAADYSCLGAPNAPSITSCVGTVANGSTIDTSKPGTFTFTVTGTNANGFTRTVTNTYTVGAPSALINAPQDGATYPLAQQVASDYTCSEAAGAPGLASCTGPVPNGQPFDTSTLGAHTFSVTATSTDGLVTTVLSHYQVTIAPPLVYINTPQDQDAFGVGKSVQADYFCQDGAGAPGISSCTGTVDSGAPIDTTNLGSHAFTVTATSLDGQNTTVTNHYFVVDPPSAGIASPANGANYQLGQQITASYSCIDSTNAPGIDTCGGTVPDGGQVDTSTPGQHTFTVTATSLDGLTGSASSTYWVAVPPPTETVTSPADGATYSVDQTVDAAYTCVDSALGPGIASCLGNVPVGSPINTVTAGSHTFTVHATSQDGQTSQASVTYTVVAAGPTAGITTPTSGGTYTFGQQVLADYACSEATGGPGISSCAGPVGIGSPIDTGTVGTHTFTVTATSLDSQTGSESVTYTVVALPPAVTVNTPMNGATFDEGAVVVADYSCLDGAGDTGLVSCSGPASSGSPIDTSTPGTHSFSVTATASDGQTTTVTNTYTVVSSNVIAPVVTSDPVDATVLQGGTATFAAAASGTPAPTVQWLISMDGVNFTGIPGATSGTLTISQAAQPQATFLYYRAVFSNVAGSATTAVARLTVIAATSSATLSSSQVTADGVASATVQVTESGLSGVALVGRTIELVPTRGNAAWAVKPGLVQRGISGSASFAISDSTPEAVTFTVLDVTEQPVQIGGVLTVTFLGPSSLSSAGVVPANVPADGATTASVLVILRDANNNPVAGKSIVLTPAAAASWKVSPATAVTDSTGRAVFTVADAKVETVSFDAIDVSDNSLAIGQSLSVTFQGPSALSRVSVSASEVPSDGQTRITVNVDVIAVGNFPLPGRSIALYPSNNPSWVVSPATTTTGSAGRATFVLTDAKAETISFNAIDLTDSNVQVGASTMVVFLGPDLPSSVVVVPAAVPAGLTTANITVTLKDKNGDVLPGKTVQLQPSVAAAWSLSPASPVTDSSGQARFTASDSKTEAFTFSVVDATDSAAGPSGSVAFTPAALGSASYSTGAGATASQIASGGSVSAAASGGGPGDMVVVGQYGSNPGGLLKSAAGPAFDVMVAQPSTYTSVTVKDCNLGGGTTVEWWTGTAWQAISPAPNYVPGNPPCVTFTLTVASTPTLAQLTGTVFSGVDLEAPAVALSQLPANPTNKNRPSIGLVASDPDDANTPQTFCSFDGGPFTACSSPASPTSALTDGNHTFSVHAVDSSGNQSSDVTYNWLIDTAQPVVSYGSHQLVYTVDQNINIPCSVSDPPPSSGIATSSCAAIAGPAYTFHLGLNNFTASATDKAGNTGTASISFTVTVTPASLCSLTKQFAEGSPQFAKLPPATRSTIDSLTTTMCNLLATIQFSPAFKPLAVAAYQVLAKKLASNGWLTPSQAQILLTLAAAL